MFSYSAIYLYMVIFLTFILLFSFFLIFLIYMINQRFSTLHLQSTVYECGFLPFHGSRISVKSQFLLIALSFIIFDLEIAFLIPWALSCFYTSYFASLVFFIFFIIILFGLVFEYKNDVFVSN